MEVEIQNENDIKKNEIDPAGNPVVTPQPPPETAEAKAYRLELENAELRGKASVLEKKPEPAKPEPTSSQSAEETKWEATKATVSGHLGSMDDEKFEEQYKMNKSDARAELSRGDQNIQTTKTNERTSRMEAENRLYRKYKDYGEFEDEIRESIADAAPEIRQDPERLTKYLERHYRAASANKPKSPEPAKPPTGDDPMNRRIVNDFVPPNPSPDLNNPRNLNPGRKGELAPENAKFCKAFGIDSEEERQKFMGKEIEMNMGGGVVFRDSKKGFEKTKR